MTNLSNGVGIAALVMFFAYLAITNFGGLWWLTGPLTVLLIWGVFRALCDHGFGK